ncbi:hypothetical protein ACOME3_003060 [Neoechinorhynchus agilis]
MKCMIYLIMNNLLRSVVQSSLLSLRRYNHPHYRHKICVPQKYISESVTTPYPICYLQRLTICLCKESNSSVFARSFVTERLVDIAQKHPQVVFYVQPRRHHAPKLIAEYLDGHQQTVQILSEFTEDRISEWIDFLIMRQGHDIVEFLKDQHTDHPSCQSMWNPYTFADTRDALRQFPDPELVTDKECPPSADQMVIELFKQQQEKSMESK